MTPLCVLGIEKMLNIWPWSDVDQSSQRQIVITTRKFGFPFVLPRSGRKKYVRMEIAVILVGIALLRKLPFPMLCLPMTISTWLLSNDAAFLFPGPSTAGKHSKLSALVGLVMLLLAAWLDFVRVWMLTHFSHFQWTMPFGSLLLAQLRFGQD